MTNENLTLPLLPLKSGVVLPGMVFTMALESDEARAAAQRAGIFQPRDSAISLHVGHSP